MDSFAQREGRSSFKGLYKSSVLAWYLILVHLLREESKSDAVGAYDTLGVNLDLARDRVRRVKCHFITCQLDRDGRTILEAGLGLLLELKALVSHILIKIQI
jgi:hypothetical protein